MRNRADDRLGAEINKLSVDKHERHKDQIAFEVTCVSIRWNSSESSASEQWTSKTDLDIDTIRWNATGLSSCSIQPDFDLFLGFQLLALPYDTSWNIGSGMPLSAWDGTSIILDGDELSVSGFGVHLTSDRHVRCQ